MKEIFTFCFFMMWSFLLCWRYLCITSDSSCMSGISYICGISCISGIRCLQTIICWGTNQNELSSSKNNSHVVLIMVNLSWGLLMIPMGYGMTSTALKWVNGVIDTDYVGVMCSYAMGTQLLISDFTTSVDRLKGSVLRLELLVLMHWEHNSCFQK